MHSMTDVSTMLQRGSDTCLLLLVCVRCTPETLLGDIHLGPIPLPYLFFIFGLFTELSCVLLTRAEILRSKGFIALFILFGISLVSGFIHGNAVRFIGIDVVFMSAMFYGLFWGSSRSPLVASRFISRRFVPIVFMLGVLTIVGTQTGHVSPAFESERTYTYSQFDAIFLLCMSCPIVCATLGSRLSKLSLRFLISFAPLLLAVILAYDSASRSGTACCAVAALSLCTLMFEGRTRLALAWLFGVLVIGCSISHQGMAGDSLLLDRISSTTFENEDRYTEVLLMLDDLEGSEIFGKGLGSRFATNIDAADPYALAPHVGLLALLHKAGFFLFSIVVAMPILFCISLATLSLFKNELRHPPHRIPICFIWAFIVCVTQMSLSSGWDVLHLFFVSACFSSATMRSSIFAFQGRVAFLPSRTSLRESVLPQTLASDVVRT